MFAPSAPSPSTRDAREAQDAHAIRRLGPAPSAVVDPVTGIPRYGSYLGSIPGVDLSSVAGGTFRRIAREKRWVYVAIASEEAFVAVAIARFEDARRPVSPPPSLRGRCG